MSGSLKYKIISSIPFFVFIFIFGFSVLSPFLSTQNSGSNEIDTNYTTSKYFVTIDVNEDNTYTVTEDISVDFNRASHGIIRYIPTSGAYKFKKDGKNIAKPYRCEISAVSSNVTQYTYNEDGFLVIRLGDPYITVTGPVSYKISYTYDAKEDYFKDYDLFYYNVIPQYWATSIKSSGFKINFPKSFDTDKINTYCGEFGSISSNGFYVTTSDDGYSIEGNSTRSLNAYEGASVLVQLDNGYFTNQGSYSDFIAVLIAVSIIVAVITIVLWFAFGKDNLVIPVVSFEPPEGMTSAEAGLIINGTVDDRDLLSLIIYWADKGYISIDTTDEKNLNVTKLSNLPDDAKKFEKTIFNSIFGKREINYTVNLNSLGYSFVHDFENAGEQLKQTFVSIEAQSPASKIIKFLISLIIFVVILLSFSFSNGVGSLALTMFLIVTVTFLVIKSSASVSTPIFSKSSIILQTITSITAYIPILAVAIFYTNYFNYQYKYMLGIIVVCIIMFLINSFGKKFVDNYYATKPKLITLGYIALLILNLAAGFSILYFSYSRLYCLLPMTIALICTYIAIYFSLIMKKRSKQGERYLGEILGLRDFIITAEKDRIEALVDENPQYFYHVLPFAYALGISSAWAERFEGLTMYSSPYINTNMPVFNPILFNNTLNNSFSRVRSNMIQTNIEHNAGKGFGSSGSSGGGFSGGGFSGGGFSGGGGGGGGGHSW